jgi:hypothetical protein
MHTLLDIRPSFSGATATPEPSLRDIVVSYYSRLSPDGKKLAEKYVAEWTRMQRPLSYRSK